MSFAALAAVPLNASSYTFSESVSISPAFLQLNNTAYYETFAIPTFNLQAGDTIAATITFSNGSISVANTAGDGAGEGAELESLDPSDPQTHWSGTVELLGLTGNFGLSNPTSTAGYGGAVLGGIASTLEAQDFSFTGFAFDITLLSLTLDNQPVTSPFTLGAIGISASSLTVNAVPEPGTPALVPGGLGLAWMLRRKTRSA